MALLLAHLSDPHLPPADLPPLWRLGGKQLLSYLAWRRKQRREPTGRALAALLEDIALHGPDLVAVTGDLTNFALPMEFAAGRDFLARLGPPERVTVVPGNHDALVPVPWAEGVGRWMDHMRGDAADPDGHAFPFVRRHGDDLALIGLSTAIATPPGLASGRLGAGQVERLASALAALRCEDRFRIVLIHHPPAGEAWRRALRDRRPLLAVLRREGAELVLHGHRHRTGLVPLAGPMGWIPMIGVPPALSTRRGHEAARWHLLRIERIGGRWSLSILARGYDAATGRFSTLGEWRLHLPAGGPPPVRDQSDLVLTVPKAAQ